MMSVTGFIAASGVVVNSSLVLDHAINARHSAGSTMREAVLETAASRFRPIVLTSLTTFVGLSPLLLNQSVQAQFLVPMACSLAFGVLSSTVVTLFVVPCGYVILEDLRSVTRQRQRAPAIRQDSPTPSLDLEPEPGIPALATPSLKDTAPGAVVQPSTGSTLPQ